MSDQAPAACLRVINASQVLDASAKVLLGEIFHLDRTHRGCYAGQVALARRVGRGVDATKACRTKLRDFGLLERSEERLSGDRRRCVWFFALPERYWPSEFAKDAKIFDLADQLDKDLRDGKLRKQAEDARKLLHALKGQIGGVGTTHSNEKQGASRPPIKEEQGVSTPEVGGVDADNGGCAHPVIGGVGTPPYKRTQEDYKERLSTQTVASNVQQKDTQAQPDPNTKPRPELPACPHPRGSREWTDWYRARLHDGAGA